MNRSAARQCQGKVRHASYAGAAIAARESGLTHGDLTLVAYPCKHCGGFHVGHPKRSAQKRLRFNRLLQLIARANAPGAKEKSS